MSPRCLARLGLALIGIGIAGILWGVFHVLAAADPPGQTDFAHRIPYDQAKRAVHATFAGGLLRSLGGLGVALVGGWLRNLAREREREEKDDVRGEGEEGRRAPE